MANVTTTNTLLAWLLLGQLPTPKNYEKKGEDKTPAPQGDDIFGGDPRLKKLNDKLNEAYESTRKREAATPQGDTFKGLSRDPLSTLPTTEPTTGIRRTPQETQERNALMVLTRNPYLPDDGFGANAGLRMNFELQHGGFPTEALDLVSYATKPVTDGGLGLEVEIGDGGLPTGYLKSSKYPGKFILQFQDNSIFVTGRKDSTDKELPGITYVKNDKGQYVIDKSRTEMLLGTAPLTELGAYRLNSNEYTAWLPEPLQQLKGLSTRIALQPQADGTIYDRTNQRTFLKKGNEWVWDTKRSEPLRTTYLITNMDLRPLPQMSTTDFRTLVGYTPIEPRPIQMVDRTRLFINSKNCMKHNPDSPFMHGPGYSSPSFNNNGPDLSAFFERRDSKEDLIKSLLEPGKTPLRTPSSEPTPEDIRLLTEWLRNGAPAEPQNIPEAEPAPIPIPQDRVQAFVGNNGYYIITPNNLYWFKDPSLVRGNNTPLVYNFDQEDASSRSTSLDGTKFLRLSEPRKSEIDAIVKNGNIDINPVIKLARN